MKLTDFLTDLTDSGKVLVEAKQLREFAQLCDTWKRVATSGEKKIKSLLYENEKLKDSLNFYELNKPITVDLMG